MSSELKDYPNSNKAWKVLNLQLAGPAAAIYRARP
jgi:hypothetical protein